MKTTLVFIDKNNSDRIANLWSAFDRGRSTL